MLTFLPFIVYTFTYNILSHYQFYPSKPCVLEIFSIYVSTICSSRYLDHIFKQSHQYQSYKIMMVFSCKDVKFCYLIPLRSTSLCMVYLIIIPCATHQLMCSKINYQTSISYKGHHNSPWNFHSFFSKDHIECWSCSFITPLFVE